MLVGTKSEFHPFLTTCAASALSRAVFSRRVAPFSPQLCGMRRSLPKNHMKLPVPAFPFIALLASSILTGCITEPAKPAPAPKVAAAPSTPVTPGNGVPSLPVVDIPTTPPPLSAEAAEFVARFTQPAGSDALPHEVADTSSFPEAMASLQPGAAAPKFETIDMRSEAPPEGLTADGNSTQLIVRDWTGLVLVPISTSLSMAHTSAVRLLKVEAHPLTDGRVRVWIRVQNISRRNFTSEVACEFRMRNEGPSSRPYFYELQVPARGYRDVFFVSPQGQLSTYTVLVRPYREM